MGNYNILLLLTLEKICLLRTHLNVELGTCVTLVDMQNSLRMVRKYCSTATVILATPC